MERAAADAHDACWFLHTLDRAATDADDARCVEADDGTCSNGCS